SVARRRAEPLVPLLLRAAPPSRARLRCVEGHPRRALRGRAADADGDLASPAPNAGLDEGLPVVARGCGPGDVAPEALQLHRSCPASLGAAALPPGSAIGRRCRAGGAALRARTSAEPRCRARTRACGCRCDAAP